MSEQPIVASESEVTLVHSPASELLRVSVGRAVMSLAAPAIAANLLENISTTVDLIMVGKLGAAEVAAVGTCGMVFWVLSALAIGLSVSSMAIVARNVGGGERGEASQALGQTLILGIVISVVVAALTIVFAPAIFDLFGVEPDVGALSVDYLRIISVGMVFFSVMAVGSGALRGAGDARTPMFVGLIVNAIHIALNYLLIFGKWGFPEMGTRGAAIGTAASYALAAAMYAALFLRNRLVIGITWEDLGWDSKRAWQVVRLGFPAAAEQFVVQFGLLMYVKFIVEFGTIALSGYQVGMRVLSLSFIPNFGFSTAASALIGQNLGAQRKREARQSGWICLWWAIVSMSSIGLIFLLFSRWLADVFVDDAEVIELAAIFIRTVGICQAGMAVHFTLAGALRGAGDTRWPLYSTLLGMYACRIPGTWLLTRFFGMGLIATWNMLFIDYIVRVIVILTRYWRGKWTETRI
ncbi:MAG: MATE family efflux transporter [Candidatus Abyssubacteria bacterium]